eukprot:TRINITY_DN8321_c0_g1_i1.p1 TRINITY_DN8321_c0_g1~~TRINITY_DN8321_c0_g1_i1.p1  ORF type:complete len:735 (-),score=140.03 TRINITY_DN8321_c0_g1_i1:226-2430(-)
MLSPECPPLPNSLHADVADDVSTPPVWFAPGVHQDPSARSCRSADAARGGCSLANAHDPGNVANKHGLNFDLGARSKVDTSLNLRSLQTTATFYGDGASNGQTDMHDTSHRLPGAVFDPDDPPDLLVPPSVLSKPCRVAGAADDESDTAALLQQAFTRHVGKAQEDIQKTFSRMMHALTMEQQHILGQEGPSSPGLRSNKSYVAWDESEDSALSGLRAIATETVRLVPSPHSSLHAPRPVAPPFSPRHLKPSPRAASKTSRTSEIRTPRSARNAVTLSAAERDALARAHGCTAVDDRLPDKQPSPRTEKAADAKGEAKAAHTCFGGGEALRQQIKDALEREQYDVRNFYWDTGISQRIARSTIFENLTMVTVMLATIWIGVTAELDENSSSVLVIENGFALYFLFEWTVRFLSFKEKKNCVRDVWFIFDSALLCLIVLETWVMRIINTIILNQVSAENSLLRMLQVVRLTRMARLVRLLRWMPELVVLLKGIMLASRSVFFTLLLLLMIVYVFALTMKEFTSGTPLGEDLFASVPDAMVSLLMGGVLPDQAEFVLRCGEEGFVFAFLSMIFVLFASLTVMNMLVGVLVDVVALVSNIENETMVIECVREKMERRFDELGLDADGDGCVSREEFQTMLMDVDTAVFLDSIGIDVMTLVEFSDVIIGENELKFHEFIGALVAMRVGNPAKVKDIIDVRKFLINEFDHRLDQMRRQVDGVNKNVKALSERLQRQLKV